MDLNRKNHQFGLDMPANIFKGEIVMISPFVLLEI